MKTTLDILAPWRSQLESIGLRCFDDFMSVRGGPPVSSHAHRETIPIDLEIEGERRRFYLKRVHRVPPKHAFWPLLRGRLGHSQPCREWHNLIALEQAGIPAMGRVAYGERRKWGMPRQAFLLVEAAPMPYTLDDWLSGKASPNNVSGDENFERLFFGLGELMAQLHVANIEWPDLSGKHIFAKPEIKRDDQGRSKTDWLFCLIDVERMRDFKKVRGSTRQKIAKDVRQILAICSLDDALWPYQIDSDLLTAGFQSKWRELHGEESDLMLPELSLLIDVNTHSHKNTPQLPDDFTPPRDWPLQRIGKMVIDRRYETELSALGIAKLDDVFNLRSGDQLNKPGLERFRQRIRLEIPGPDGKSKNFFLKRYLKPPLQQQLRRMIESNWRRGEAWRESHFIRKLNAAGVPTMQMAAYGQDLAGCWERRSFILTEAISGQSLETVVDGIVADPRKMPRIVEKREIIRQVARLTRRLHDKNCFHRDLYLCHIFLTHNAAGEPVLQLIDLARMLENPLRPRRWQIKDLAALAYSSPSTVISRTDRLRFVFEYNGGSSQSRPVDRQLLRAVARRVQKMARHDAKRKKRLSIQ